MIDVVIIEVPMIPKVTKIQSNHSSLKEAEHLYQQAGGGLNST